MTVEKITLLAGVYIVGAVIVSLVVAFRLDVRLKARLPGTRPCLWGFFFGCVCLALCAPLVVASALETVVAFSRERWAACHLHAVCTVGFALTAVCGWFIIRRKGWAWLLGSLLAPVSAFPVLQDMLGWLVANVGFVGAGVWAINYVYGRKRWREFYPAALTVRAEASKTVESLRAAGGLGMTDCRLPLAN